MTRAESGSRRRLRRRLRRRGARRGRRSRRRGRGASRRSSSRRSVPGGLSRRALDEGARARRCARNRAGPDRGRRRRGLRRARRPLVLRHPPGGPCRRPVTPVPVPCREPARAGARASAVRPALPSLARRCPRQPGRSLRAAPRRGRLVRELEISEITAAVLVRRGYGEPAVGTGVPRRRVRRARPAPARRHGGGVRAHPRRRGCRTSGSASTATTTSTGSAPPRSPSSTLRELGADVGWHLPSRFDEGYGVSADDDRRGSPTRGAASS